MLRLTLLAASVWGVGAGSALAYSEFQIGFYKVYTKGPGVDNDFRKLARKAKCNVCHQGKDDRTNYNPYGLVLCEHLTEDDKKDKKKIAAALALVAEAPSDGPGSPTFGELIARGELPGGPLDAVQQEPDEAAD